MTKLNLTYLSNVANCGKGSDMTACLHQAIDEIKRLDQFNTELALALRTLMNKVTGIRGIDMDFYAYAELEAAEKVLEGLV